MSGRQTLRLCCACAALAGGAAIIRAQTTAPASAPAAGSPPPETAAQRVEKLRRTPASQLSRDELAYLAGVQFLLAVGAGDATRALERLDVTGYQPLPLRGPLPGEPGRPIVPEALRIRIRQQQPAALGALPHWRFSVLNRAETREHFSAVARWMLDDDLAVVFEPPAGLENWTRQPCCVVVRVRGQRATVMGGNVFAALEAAP